jgi:hypothetical protein
LSHKFTIVPVCVSVGAECPGGKDVIALEGFWQDVPKLKNSSRVNENVEYLQAVVYQCSASLGLCLKNNSCEHNRTGKLIKYTPNALPKLQYLLRQNFPASSVELDMS